MVPPWVPDVPEDGNGDQAVSPDAPAPPPGPAPIAPPARFGGARRSLGSFARTGDRSDMRRGLGHYVRSGYGGAGTTTRRFAGTARTAGALDAALAGAAGRQTVPGSPLDPVLLEGRSAEQVMNAIVEAVRPIDGSQDTESARVAIRDSLAELLTRFPEADLLNLNAEQRAFVIERFTASDVYNRFHLDVGRAIVENAPTAATALSRLRQVKDYVKEAVAASFRRLRDAGRALTAGRVSQLVRDALGETFQVFEGYAE
ncbi:MAG TPA: Qat anti-phage system associated protein QatB [Longimicrobiaceae bacterium]|nr:Qat anti-phage system associated protein QatB [Longimicrobiaceae bacterium]